MADKVKYEVLRRLDGDRLYEAGDTRELFPAEAAHLVASGALREVGGSKRKAEGPALNKAEGSAPANKVETSPVVGSAEAADIAAGVAPSPGPEAGVAGPHEEGVTAKRGGRPRKAS